MKRVLIALAFLALTNCSSAPDYEDIARSMDLPADVRPICGFPDVLGLEIEDIDGGAGNGCGASDPVKVFAVGATRMSTSARLNCQAVGALRDWLSNDAQASAWDEKRTYISEVKVAASYACRTRNHRKGARLSEHAKGNAIDISGLTLANGDKVTILGDYYKGKYAAMLKSMRQAACGTFGTVLGPGSDRHHRDHFHFDVAGYRSGPYCK